MTLAEALLAKLAEPRTASPGRFTLLHSDGAAGWSVAMNIDKADALGCQLSEIACERISGAAPDLKAWAESLANRVTGLMEPLQVVEVDLLKNEALLRSDEPTIRNQKRAHFELKLEGGRRAILRRYQAAIDPFAKREPTSFVLTNEVLGNLIDDLTGSIG